MQVKWIDSRGDIITWNSWDTLWQPAPTTMSQFSPCTEKKYKHNGLQYPSLPLPKKIVSPESSWIQRGNVSRYMQGLSSGTLLWILICSLVQPHVIFTWGLARLLQANFHFLCTLLSTFPSYSDASSRFQFWQCYTNRKPELLTLLSLPEYFPLCVTITTGWKIRRNGQFFQHSLMV